MKKTQYLVYLLQGAYFTMHKPRLSCLHMRKRVADKPGGVFTKVVNTLFSPYS